LDQLGKYQLIRKIATGGMAEVFLAKAAGPTGFQKKLVVKRILPHHSEDPSFIEMFLSEAKLAAELNHPNIVQIFDFGEVGGQYYIAMEYIDGPNLRVLAQRARSVGEPIPFATCAKIISHACEGLAFAHDFKDPETRSALNLVHRDISPDNILLSKVGAVKVVDFGIAKVSTQTHRTKSGVIKGKMAYMPPEQLGRQDMDRRVDVFALGMVLYELLTGQLPFDATSEVSIIQAIMSEEPFAPVSSLRPDVPPELERIALTCLEKDRERRFADCRQLQAALDGYVQSTGETIYPQHLSSLVTRLELEGTDSGPMVLPTPLPSGGGLEATVQKDAAAPSRPHPSSVKLSSASQKKGPHRWLLAAIAVAAMVASYLLLAHFQPQKTTSPIAEALPPIPAARAMETQPAPEPTPPPPAPPEPEREPEPPAPKPAAAAKPKPARKGTLELRIRPFAEVYLNGELLGQTPLRAVSVAAGTHSVRMVNAELGMDVTKEVTVSPNEAKVFKYNLKQ
jgi:serine/threonine-protein kinase